jgi:hypothetical protein
VLKLPLVLLACSVQQQHKLQGAGLLLQEQWPQREAN